MIIALKLPSAVYLIADKYYCSGPFIKKLIGSNVHIITMMKKNAVAYDEPVITTQRRGRPRKYGKKIKLFDLFDTGLNFIKAPMPGDSQTMIEYFVVELFWRPLGKLVKFVLVHHPEKGNSIVMSTDRTLEPMDVIFGYTMRFKIEVMFKQAVHQIGTFMYRFWLKMMLPNKRGKGGSVLQFEPRSIKEQILKKVNAYHLFIQLGIIAHGLIQYLSIHNHQCVWNNFGSWLRTIRVNTLPSEMVVSLALSKSFSEFLIDGAIPRIFKKLLIKRIDLSYLKCSRFKDKKAA